MLPFDNFDLCIIGLQRWNVDDCNVDVEVKFSDGRRFGATFFTLLNLRSLFDKNKETGECAGGAYLWAADMILVEQLSIDVIRKAVVDLIENGQFIYAFTEFPLQTDAS